MTEHTPPVLARALLSGLTSKVATGMLGDIDEEFRTLSAEGEPRAARAWYWGQVLHSVQPLIALRTRTVLANVDLGGALVGIVGLLAWLVTTYAVIEVAGPPGDSPLADLHPAAFLLGWVFGGAAIGGFAGRWLAPGNGRSVALLVGLFASLFLLLGIDEPLSAGHQVLLSAIAVGGALTGAATAQLTTRQPLNH